MIYGSSIAVFLLLGLLALSAYVDRIYFEMGKFLSREYYGEHRGVGEAKLSRG